ncbi:MAG: glycosyltransferase [Nevskiales bacterium]|nr:glycosyltransferase [Nevskiales bacterium]
MKRLGVLISFSGDGGVERMVANLCSEFARHVHVDLLTIRAEGGHVARISSEVNMMPLKTRHAWSAVPEVADYLRRERPDALLAAKDRAGRAALKARRRSGVDVPVWIRLGTNLSAALARKDAFSRWLRVAPMRRLYPTATGVIAVSEGVRRDTVSVTGLSPERVRVIRNPVITASLAAQAAEPVPHPWLSEKVVPVVIGMGRLTRQKDFPTLIRAFAALQPRIHSRLILLGEGGDRAELEQLVASLGLRDNVLFAGFQDNPYAWLSRADLFVLSSAWEGSPNALTEALALGVPSVSTRCPSGPDELLDEGRYGPLVEVGDVAAMTEAMAQTLSRPLPAQTLAAAVDEYRSTVSALRYLQAMGLVSDSGMSA